MKTLQITAHIYSNSLFSVNPSIKLVAGDTIEVKVIKKIDLAFTGYAQSVRSFTFTKRINVKKKSEGKYLHVIVKRSKVSATVLSKIPKQFL